MTKKQAIKVLKDHNEGIIGFNSISDRIQIREALEVCFRLLSKPAKPKCKHPNCKGGRIKTWSRKGFVSCLDCKVKPAKRRKK